MLRFAVDVCTGRGRARLLSRRPSRVANEDEFVASRMSPAGLSGALRSLFTIRHLISERNYPLERFRRRGGRTRRSSTVCAASSPQLAQLRDDDASALHRCLRIKYECDTSIPVTEGRTFCVRVLSFQRRT